MNQPLYVNEPLYMAGPAAPAGATAASQPSVPGSAALLCDRDGTRHGLFPELRTGDYGWIDADGYVYFVGRGDDLYKERGFRVSTTEVEAAARRVPGVDRAVVLPPDGERTAELVVVSALASGKVLTLLREQIEPMKIPRCCTVVEDLPLNGNRKVGRRALADRLKGEGGGPRPQARI
ncbi:AMP-binding enzyme [Streptomyces hiroshimensis]|uniref:AMP-binding enzyme C-terminal domain-containing protein n=1 Tax=Streptomyces hiroshimensis TaxID=66424 RepID=A0ABQ2YAB3_9ACTN|nr:hypothetical protein [Streptomyces hiroshimensis]GGX73965.1 hypothetical protein GCM10010324_19130 [Streptomyces hiroshimensis]